MVRWRFRSVKNVYRKPKTPGIKRSVLKDSLPPETKISFRGGIIKGLRIILKFWRMVHIFPARHSTGPQSIKGISVILSLLQPYGYKITSFLPLCGSLEAGTLAQTVS